MHFHIRKLKTSCVLPILRDNDPPSKTRQVASPEVLYEIELDGEEEQRQSDDSALPEEEASENVKQSGCDLAVREGNRSHSCHQKTSGGDRVSRLADRGRQDVLRLNPPRGAHFLGIGRDAIDHLDFRQKWVACLDSIQHNSPHFVVAHRKMK